MSNLLAPLLILLIIRCTKGYSPGEVEIDRRNARVGDNVTITCSMNLNAFKSSNSKDLRLNGTITGPVSQNDIKIINKTTIVYTIYNAEKQDQDYICGTMEYGINTVHLSVGFAPLNVTDFKCRGYDFRYMVCQFTKPNNTVFTKYTLNYYAQNPNYLQPCDVIISKDQILCNMTHSNYRQSYETFNFILTGENDLGTNTQEFRIYHYENVVPAEPQFTVEKIGTSRAELKWDMIRYSYYNGKFNGCDKGLEYEVFLRPGKFEWLDFTPNTTLNRRNSVFKIELVNLPYAHYSYEVSLRQRVTLLRHEVSCMENGADGEWSDFHNETFLTLSRVPDAAPATDVGSFYIDPTETQVRLYWEQLPSYRENAADFRYEVIRVRRNGTMIHTRPLQMFPEPLVGTSVSYAWQRDYAYEFAIKSRNAMGDSADTSFVRVPAMSRDMVKSCSPEWIRTIYHASNRTYTLSWTAPKNTIDLQNYTIFWCQNKKVTQNECKDTIHFLHVDKYQTRYSSPVQEIEHSWNFAISANYANFTTGMHWTMCVSEDSSDLIKLEPDIGLVSSKYIEIKWSLDHICSSLPEGFNITYCEVVETSTTTSYDEAICVDNKNITISVDKTKRKYLLEQLKPHTYYKINMLMFSIFKVGKVSDGKLVITKEDASLPPRKLKYWQVTSNSALISWLPPRQRNGIIRYYTIDLSNEKRIVNCSIQNENICSATDDEEIVYKLKNLSSYTGYKIYVTAHTVLDSKPSNDVHFHTLIGMPSNPRYMKENERNRSILQWMKPEVPAGRNDYYEVAVSIWYMDTLYRRRISGVYGSQACTVQIPGCENSHYKNTLEVRAVNVAAREHEIDYQLYSSQETDEDPDAVYYTGNDDLVCVGVEKPREDQEKMVAFYRNKEKYVQYKSAWEKGTEYGCADNTKLSRMTTIALVVVITSLIAMTSFYFARIKYLKMSKISIKLPGELEVVPHYPVKTLDSGGGGNVGGMGGMSLGSATSVNASDLMSKMDRDMDFHRSKESLYQPESHHLLAPSTCHDSIGYIGVAGLRNGMTPCSIGHSSGYEGSERSCDYIQQETLHAFANSRGNPLSIGGVGGAGSCETIMTPLDDPPGYQLMEQSFLYNNNNNNNHNDNSGGYVQAQSIMSGREPPADVTVAASSNNQPKQIYHWPGLVPDGANNETAVSHNGYLPSHLLPQKANAPNAPNSHSIEYTTLESLNQTIPTQFSNNYDNKNATTVDDNNDKKNDSVNDNQPISGYVTQRQLSVFGQQQQHQQQILHQLQQLKQQQQQQLQQQPHMS